MLSRRIIVGLVAPVAIALAFYRLVGFMAVVHYCLLIFAVGPWFAYLASECLPIRAVQLRAAAANMLLLVLFIATLKLAEGIADFTKSWPDVTEAERAIRLQEIPRHPDPKSLRHASLLLPALLRIFGRSDGLHLPQLRSRASTCYPAEEPPGDRANRLPPLAERGGGS